MTCLYDMTWQFKIFNMTCHVMSFIQPILIEILRQNSESKLTNGWEMDFHDQFWLNNYEIVTKMLVTFHSENRPHMTK